MIGKVKKVPLREVWKHEARNFTEWLKDNMDVLNEALDMSLATADSEQAAGDFSVDIVAEDEAGNLTIIENQLEKSDHDHLGKLITYLTTIDAKSAIWIVSEPRPEHINAINWLNETSSASFYVVKVEAIQIGSSDPAPLFTLIVGPSEESREVGKAKRELAERHLIRREFWKCLLEKAKQQTKLHANVSPTYNGWLATGAGRRGLRLTYVVGKNDSGVELYIDRGKNEEDGESKALFDQLAIHQEAIDASFGERLNWERLDGKRASRISMPIDIGGWGNEEMWPQIQDAMIDAMIRLEKALGPYIVQL